MNIQSDKRNITIYLWPKDADVVAFCMAGALIACTFFICFAWTIVKEREYKAAAIQSAAKAIESK